MILKTAANYNDEGGYIEAWKNSDGTTEVKLIPKSGGDDEENGILSVTISPAITTTPALDSLFPIYLGDERLVVDESGGLFSETVHADSVGGYNDEFEITITPTPDWIMKYDGEHTGGDEPGVPIIFKKISDGYHVSISDVWAENMLDTESPDYKSISVGITIDTTV